MNIRSLITAAAAGTAIWGAAAGAMAADSKLLPPPTGVYQGVFADLPEWWQPGVAREGTLAFVNTVGKGVALSIIGNSWTQGIYFPADAAQEVIDAGAVPVIHINPWSQKLRGVGVDALYELGGIAAGNFDGDLNNYANAVRNFNQPVVLDFAPEANGNWYPWSGIFEGGGNPVAFNNPALAIGPQRYRAAYQHLVQLFRAAGASNVTWVFHVSSDTKPVADWNKFSAYYPGDEFVDWLAVSVYSAQRPWDLWEEFTDVMDPAYAELAALSPTKPIAVLEYATIEDANSPLRKADWITNALDAVKANRYPRTKAMAYWNESAWLPSNDNNMRIDSSADALRLYRSEMADPFFIAKPTLSTPVSTPSTCLCGFTSSSTGQVCAIWKRGDATVRAWASIDQCDDNMCRQLFADTISDYCGGSFTVHH